MPQQFTFAATDPVVTGGLTTEEIAAVTQWQDTRLDYQFEFHTQHENAWPCYLREPDSWDRGLPKMNLKGRSYSGTMLQTKSIQSTQCSGDFTAVINANVELFRKLARDFYIGVEAGPAAPEQEIWHAKFTCTLGKGNREVFVRLPERGQNHLLGGNLFWSNMKGLANTLGKPTCPLHKNGLCLDTGEAVTLNGIETAKHSLKYDSDYEIV